MTVPKAVTRDAAEGRAGFARSAVHTWLLRFVGLSYLLVVLAAPVTLVFYRAFEHGIGPAWDAVTTPEAKHAFYLTVLIAAIAVPANTIFGVVCALAIVRQRFPGKGIVNALVDLPLALSPVVVGLAFLLLYSRTGWFGGWLMDHGIHVVFALPGMILVTIFVSLPFVVREVVPVLREIGTEQEQAAATLGASGWQTFRRVTLPAIRWAIAYGVVLTTARALGEFGAVSVISGHIVGKTETMTLHVEAQYQQFDYTGAYAASVVLAMIAIATLVAMTMFKPKEETR
jgi:sulfate/thiosulfate transport system permease protein